MGWYRVCETEFSQMGKNSRNPDLVCKKEVVVHSKDSDQIKKRLCGNHLSEKEKAGREQSLNNTMFGVHRNGSWYKRMVLQRDNFTKEF